MQLKQNLNGVYSCFKRNLFYTYILILILISSAELVFSIFMLVPRLIVYSPSVAYIFHFIYGLLWGVTFISFLPNIILIPIWLWKKKSYFSFIPILISILWLYISFQIDSLQPTHSVKFFINNENKYNSILMKVRNTELYDSIKTEYSYSNTQYYILNDNMSFLSPCGIECYNDGYLRNTAFLLRRSRGVKSGYLYSETGVFMNSPSFRGWYMPIGNCTNWAYFNSWYSHNGNINIPTDGRELEKWNDNNRSKSGTDN